MTVDAGKTGRANQVWFPVYTKIELFRTALRGKAKIRHINNIPLLPGTHQKVLRFDISMDDVLGMDVFETTNELVGQHQNRLKGELAAAKVEKVLQTWPQEVKNHTIVFAFRIMKVYTWNSGAASKLTIALDFIS